MGRVIYTDFNGANGYTIMIENENFIFSYSHVSPNFIVTVGDIVQKNQPIGNVGPKYIDSIINNPYIDSTGKQTNGATTGCHLHFGVKIDNQFINPMNLYKKSD